MSRPDSADLSDELRYLARGRGVRTVQLSTRVGPVLRQLTGLGDEAGVELRSRVVSWLRAGLAALPGDLRRVAEVALGLDPGADQRLLTERLGWLAVELDRDPRTVRRRYEEAVRLLAESAAWPLGGRAGGAGPELARDRAAAGAGDPPVSAPAPPPAGPWYFERVRAMLRLDGPTPELLECRRVVALEDGLSQVTLSMSLPRPAGAPASPRDLRAEVLFGGRMVRANRWGDTVFGAVLRLPHALGRHERHDFGLVWRIPLGQPMAPHYALNPTIRCDALDLRVRFPEDAEPRVQLVDGLPLRAVEDLAVNLPTVALDGACEAFARFSHLASGLSYGLRWTT